MDNDGKADRQTFGLNLGNPSRVTANENEIKAKIIGKATEGRNVCGCHHHTANLPEL
jgi:hypothetical protein